ncbi:MAG: hypothetical protein WBF87_07985, partial [Mesorhizobium sp.]
GGSGDGGGLEGRASAEAGFASADLASAGFEPGAALVFPASRPKAGDDWTVSSIFGPGAGDTLGVAPEGRGDASALGGCAIVAAGACARGVSADLSADSAFNSIVTGSRRVFECRTFGAFTIRQLLVWTFADPELQIGPFE